MMILLPYRVFSRHFVGYLYAYHAGYIDINAPCSRGPVYHDNIADTPASVASLHKNLYCSWKNICKERVKRKIRSNVTLNDFLQRRRRKHMDMNRRRRIMITVLVLNL